MTNSDFINDDNERFLIIDKVTSHITNEIIKDFIFGNREINFVPGGLTRFFQPLDVVVNKPFKSAIKEKYVAYWIDYGVDNLKVSRTKNDWNDMRNPV